MSIAKLIQAKTFSKLIRARLYTSIPRQLYTSIFRVSQVKLCSILYFFQNLQNHKIRDKIKKKTEVYYGSIKESRNGTLES